MKSYFFCLFGAALLSGVVSMAAEGSGFEKHIRYVCALVCTIAVIAPLAKADLSAIELPVVAETEVSGGESTVVDIAEQNAKEEIPLFPSGRPAYRGPPSGQKIRCR